MLSSILANCVGETPQTLAASFGEAHGLDARWKLNVLLANRHSCNVTIEMLGSKVRLRAGGQNPRATLGSVATATSEPQYFSRPLARPLVWPSPTTLIHEERAQGSV